MMNPFKIVWELIEFGIQALFVYILAIILVIVVFVIFIYESKREDTEVHQLHYRPLQGNMEIPDEPKELICDRIEGCATVKGAKTPEEYCPTCEFK